MARSGDVRDRSSPDVGRRCVLPAARAPASACAERTRGVQDRAPPSKRRSTIGSVGARSWRGARQGRGQELARSPRPRTEAAGPQLHVLGVPIAAGAPVLKKRSGSASERAWTTDVHLRHREPTARLRRTYTAVRRDLPRGRGRAVPSTTRTSAACRPRPECQRDAMRRAWRGAAASRSAGDSRPHPTPYVTA